MTGNDSYIFIMGGSFKFMNVHSTEPTKSRARSKCGLLFGTPANLGAKLMTQLPYPMLEQARKRDISSKEPVQEGNRDIEKWKSRLSQCKHDGLARRRGGEKALKSQCRTNHVQVAKGGSANRTYLGLDLVPEWEPVQNEPAKSTQVAVSQPVCCRSEDRRI
ncbi:hypothetical protein LY76DRAFT_640239 [Colletotrichum caudatum]|nr:hypothetical protein LY76DRAFT_640239 [Colletotrichum caudatum]